MDIANATFGANGLRDELKLQGGSFNFPANYAMSMQSPYLESTYA